MAAARILANIPDTIFCLEADLLTSLWKDTGGTSAVSANGDIVKRWSDQSTNACHFTEATNGPTYNATSFNSAYPGLTFDGTNDVLTAIKNFTSAHNQSFTIALAFTPLVSNNLFCYGVNTATSVFTLFWRYASGWYEFQTNAWTSVYTKYVPVVEPQVCIFKYDGVNLYLTVAGSSGRKYITAQVGSIADSGGKTGSVGISGLPMILGAYPAGPAFFANMCVAKFWANGRCITASEESEVMAYMTETLNIGKTNSVVMLGDSLTAGTNTTAGTTNSLFGKVRALMATDALNATLSCTAYPGRYMYQARAEFEKDPRPIMYKRAGRTIVPIWFGANDLIAGDVTGCLSQLQELCYLVAKEGGIPLVSTLINRGDSGSFDGYRTTFNTTLRQTWNQFAAGLIDYAAEPIMGLAATVSDTTYFQVDTIHPTTAGNTLLAAVAYPVIKRAIAGNMDLTFGSRASRRSFSLSL